MGKPRAKLQTTWGEPISNFNLVNRLGLLLRGNVRGVHPESGDVLWSSNYRKTASQLKRGLIDPIVGIGRTALSITKMKSMSPPKGYNPNQTDLRIKDNVDIKGSERYGETLTTKEVKERDKAAKIEEEKQKLQIKKNKLLLGYDSGKMVHDRESSASIRGRQKTGLNIKEAEETGNYVNMSLPKETVKKSKAQILRDLYK